jgi:hypothetical protein
VLKLASALEISPAKYAGAQASLRTPQCRAVFLKEVPFAD